LSRTQLRFLGLKSLNILVNGHNQAKLTDFGSAIAKLRTITATLLAYVKSERGSIKISSGNCQHNWLLVLDHSLGT